MSQKKTATLIDRAKVLDTPNILTAQLNNFDEKQTFIKGLSKFRQIFNKKNVLTTS